MRIAHYTCGCAASGDDVSETCPVHDKPEKPPEPDHAAELAVALETIAAWGTHPDNADGDEVAQAYDEGRRDCAKIARNALARHHAARREQP